MSTNTNRLLTAVLTLQVLTLAGQWAGHSNDARADLPPNPAERQIAMTEELKSLNSKMDKLVSLLESGRVEVKISNLGDVNKNGAGNNRK
jgi:hypothetical protein